VEGRLFGPVRELKLEAILAGREGSRPLIPNSLSLIVSRRFLVMESASDFCLREDELVLGAENADADLHRVGIASVFLLGHAEVAWGTQTEGVSRRVSPRESRAGKGNDVEIAALEDQP